MIKLLLKKKFDYFIIQYSIFSSNLNVYIICIKKKIIFLINNESDK